MLTDQIGPIFRWAGSKHQSAREIAATISAHRTAPSAVPSKRLISPFLGAGSFELEVLRCGLARSAWLADTCEPLISAFEALRSSKDWQKLAANLQGFSELPRDAQAMFFNVTRQDSCSSYIFLIRQACSFNGLWRVNKKGVYNVPFARAAVFAFEALERSAVLLQSLPVTLACCDFDQTLAQAEAGDLVFADPPWFGTHSAYNSDGFDANTHARLADALFRAKARGADVWVMGSETADTRLTYAQPGRHQTIHPIRTRNLIACKNSARGVRTDLLIHL